MPAEKATQAKCWQRALVAGATQNREWTLQAIKNVSCTALKKRCRVRNLCSDVSEEFDEFEETGHFGGLGFIVQYRRTHPSAALAFVLNSSLVAKSETDILA
ncbi:MAG: hypothetical protein PSX80_00245 [bacterium]|nr:hypothetical protein [bacterium]